MASCTTTTTASSAVPLSPYPITCPQGTVAADNYDFTSFVPGNLTVTKAHLTATADPQTKVYGAPVPSALTTTVSGFVLGHTLATSGVTGMASCTTTTTASSAVPLSPYPITCPQGTVAADNYDFTSFVPGNLTVTTAHLTATADPQTKVYGAPVPSPLTATVSGFVLGQTLATSGVTGIASCTTTATASSTVPLSPYPITCTQGTLAADNYDFTSFVPGNLTVTTAHLTVTADPQTKAYGAPVPSPLTATVSGFVLGQTLATSGGTGMASCTTTASQSSHVANNPYAITCTRS